MKKIVASLIFTAMLVSLAACGSTNTEAEENTTENAVTDSANKESAAADNKTAPEETDRSADHMEDNTMKITAGDISFTATRADFHRGRRYHSVSGQFPRDLL